MNLQELCDLLGIWNKVHKEDPNRLMYAIDGITSDFEECPIDLSPAHFFKLLIDDIYKAGWQSVVYKLDDFDDERLRSMVITAMHDQFLEYATNQPSPAKRTAEELEKEAAARKRLKQWIKDKYSDTDTNE
jgi:hypothetical protein